MSAADDFSKVFSFGNLYESYRQCTKGVAWKSSVQRYIATAPVMVYQTKEKLMSGKYKSPGFNEFDVCDRGKVRHIRSTSFGERVVQRCLCSNALEPALLPSMIHDNGACVKKKGFDFAIRRITQHLHEHYRKHGQEGYVLLFDFSDFYNSISHELINGIVDKTFSDERIKALIRYFVGNFGDVGVGMGNNISQIFALAAADRLDHYVKEVLRVRGYGRYMDDGYLIHPSKDFLRECLRDIKAICDELHLNLNLKKTQIVRLSHGFTWLKTKFYLTATGKVVRKISRTSITRMRRRLKKLKKLFSAGRITYRDAFNALQSWRSHARRFDAWHTIKNTEYLFNRLFVFAG